ncbi:MAG: hypothetical protein NTX22_07045 [Ignavibacteriales bacterium]|nr:hypothetical protein [Ignavibacteriales bacterium]
MRKILYLIFFLSSFVLGQRADFFKEDITFRLDSLAIDVDGYYWFANRSDKTIESNIFYPFPNYSDEKIDSIRLYNLSDGRETSFAKEGENGISFFLNIPPFDTVIFQIGYRQKLIGDSAVYILRTTQGWGKPIAYAEFKLIVSNSFLIKQFIYPPDKTYKFEKYKIYYWKKENFMPVQDMIFYF